jgi:two-component system cell cycle response regulator
MNVRSHTRLARALLVAAIACLGAVLLRNLGVTSPVLTTVWNDIYYLTEALAIAVCGLRVLSCTGSERAAWGVLTVGLTAFFLGDVYYEVLLPADSPPYPSLADAGYLCIYPTAYVALVLLLRARTDGVSPLLWLDGIIGGLAATAVGAALVLGVVASTDGPLATVITNLAYPLGDLIMLAFVIVVMTVTGRRGGSTWAVLALAFAVWGVADSLYLYQSASGTYREFTVLDTAWPATYVLIAVAAWRPVQRLDTRRLRASMLALPALMTSVALALLVVDHYVRLNQAAIWLACASIATAVARFGLVFRQNLQLLDISEQEASTDALTGLGNRRALLRDLDRVIADATEEDPAVLALFDLDGFKTYNDTFGHLAGDALLARLGHTLRETTAGQASAYRMGGDEFCLLSSGRCEDPEALVAVAVSALQESGERFTIGCSHGAVLLPTESSESVEALRLADQRMYSAKRSGRRSNDEAVHQVLLRVAAEHDGELRHHVDDVADFAELVGRELGLAGEALLDVRRAAQLHDIGKVAIPDAILHAPRALTQTEWTYMRQHTIIGERIINAAPELKNVAHIVRASHERYDGAGYPDGTAGEDIPLGARIVAVCDAYDAMVTTRAYRGALPVEEALAELERCAGAQFDPAVVEAFIGVLDQNTAQKRSRAERSLVT